MEEDIVKKMLAGKSIMKTLASVIVNGETVHALVVTIPYPVVGGISVNNGVICPKGAYYRVPPAGEEWWYDNGSGTQVKLSDKTNVPLGEEAKQYLNELV